MNRTFISKVFIPLLSILAQVSLYAQECGQPSTACCSDYVYYNTEESRCMGSSRVAVIVGSAIIAGGVIGAVAISATSKHHKGSQSARYSEVSNEVSGPNHHHNHNHEHEHDYSDYNDFSGFNHESHYSHNSNDPNSVFETRAKYLSKPIVFDIEVETEDLVTIAAYVEGPDGVVFEGEAQTITSRTALPEIAIPHPAKGSYHVGIRTLTSTTKLPAVRVKVIENQQVTELNNSGIYIVD